MKVIYIAGPFRGPHAWAIEQNVRRAEEAAYAVFAHGHAALCPHTNTRFFDGALPDQVFIDGTLELMRRCDAVLVLRDWLKSQGTTGEVLAAVEIPMPVVYLDDFPDIATALKHLDNDLGAVGGVNIG